MDLAIPTLLVASAIAFAAPLIFAAMGELISEKAGVINIQLDGMMLAGAFTGTWAALASGSLLVGFVGAAAGGAAVAAIHGTLCLGLKADQVVSGVVLNILILGLTTFGIGAVFASDMGNAAPTLKPLPIPLLSDIPVIGRALFTQTPTVYLALLTVPAVWWLINRTTVGLALQAAGEAPGSARSMGIRVGRLRWAALIACGALAGIGGGQLVLAGLGTFTQNVTAGRGFIALAAVVFGRWRPVGALVAVLLFTTVEAVQVRAQVLGIELPYQFLVMAPYVATLVALTLFTGRSRPPRALGSND
ncbi:MAG: ABC transporter permease [Azospirillaceae bacterium]